jgi:hypothetical protein
MEKAALKGGFFVLNGLNEIGTSRGSVLTRRDTGRAGVEARPYGIIHDLL